MQPNVEFRVELPKTNPGLAKSHFQQETRGYAQKTAPDNYHPQIGDGRFLGHPYTPQPLL